MENKSIVEGFVVEQGNEVFLQIHPPKRDVIVGYRAEDLLNEFKGRRVRVTVEIIE